MLLPSIKWNTFYPLHFHIDSHNTKVNILQRLVADKPYVMFNKIPPLFGGCMQDLSAGISTKMAIKFLCLHARANVALLPEQQLNEIT